MIRNPKTWRNGAGLTLAKVAAECGITGRNPARTYNRYETGEKQAPAEVVAAVDRVSGGKVRAASFQAVRMAWLEANKDGK